MILVLLTNMAKMNLRGDIMETPGKIMTANHVFISSTIVKKIGEYLMSVILLIIDYGVIVCALLTTWYIRDQILLDIFPGLAVFHLRISYVYFVIPAIYLLFFFYEGLYTKRLPFWKSTEILFKICSYVNVLAIVLLYFADRDANMPRLFVGLSWMISFLYLAMARYVAKRLFLYCGLWQKPVVILGAGKTAEILANRFGREPQLGYRIVGLIEDQYKNRPLIHKYPYIGTFTNAEQAIIESGVQDVIVAVPGMERKKLLDLIYRIQPHVRNLTVVPDLFGIPLSNMEVETLYNEKTVMLKVKNNLTVLHNRLLKRFFDILIGSCVFLLAMPVMGLLAVLIKQDSKGPVFHIAKRIGKGGKEFYCFKFRTMFLNADAILETYFKESPEAKMEWERFAKLKGYDPRVTKVGSWLRKYSLDELPQIFNVLWGNMSLVGPRPYLPREKAQMGYATHTILETVPGITGLWQVSGRNEIEFEGRLQLDSWYVRNWSLWQDIVLLMKTVNVVFNKKGAY